ncbi:MAG: hypothetical protein AAF936_09315 [Pseudomonadota bacterium]
MIKAIAISAASALAAFTLNASASAAGGSEAGAHACAAAIAQEVDGYTHVRRSIRANFTVEEFWLTANGSNAEAYCAYDRQKNEVRKVLMVDNGAA